MVFRILSSLHGDLLQIKRVYMVICLKSGIYTIFSLRTPPRTAHTLISGKSSFRAMILGRFSLLQSPYVDFQKKLFPRNDFEPFQHTPELSFQIPISAPRTAHTLIFRKNGSRAMILSRFSILQSSDSNFSSQNCPYVDFQKKLFPRDDFEPFQHASSAQ